MWAAAYALLCLLLAGPASAADPGGLSLEVQPALGELAKVEEFLPLHVEVSNRGAGVDARLLARYESPAGYPSPISAVADVELPSGSRKEVALLLPRYYPYLGPIRVELQVGGEVLLYKELELHAVSGGEVLLLVLSPEPEAFGYVGGYTDPVNGLEVRLGRPDPARLPDRWPALAGADLIVVHDLPALGLTRGQMRALADWVRAGGTLVAVPALDPTEHQGSPLESLLPFEPRGTVQAGTLTLLAGAVREGASLADHEGRPLLVAGERARGMVAVLTAPLTGPDQLGSDATQAVWGELLKFRTESQAAAVPWRPEGLLGRMPEMRPPRFSVVGWCLLLYVILAGPVNYLLLRRLDRMVWVYFTTPAMAALFTLAALVGGHLLKGSEALLAESGLVAAESGGGTAVAHGALALYAPRSARYHLSLPDGVYCQEESGGWSEAGSLVRLRLGERLLLEDLELPVWSMKRFQMRRPVLLPGPIRFEAREAGGRLEVQVENASGMDLETCAVIRAGKVAGPFRLPAGRQRLALEAAAGDLSFMREPSEADPFAKDREALSQLLEAHLREHPPLEPVLAGWLGGPRLDARLEGREASSRGLYLVVVRGGGP